MASTTSLSVKEDEHSSQSKAPETQGHSLVLVTNPDIDHSQTGAQNDHNNEKIPTENQRTSLPENEERPSG